jgi:hypothetical protein
MWTSYLHKHADKSSPAIFIACANGKHFPNATLTVRKAGEHPHEYLIYKMDNVFLSHYGVKGNGGDIALETLSLNFSKIEMTYVPQNKDGTAGAKIVKAHDIAANKGWVLDSSRAAGGEQKMTVQHVHVAEGGQAIVGNVNVPTEGARSRKKSEDQPYAFAYAPGVETPRQIEASGYSAAPSVRGP